ncbi:MAG: DUF3592 domain-containing protein [Comamonadaceae bacterium]|nr:DUF3592 domain-containing protein [Comamonadaceae bacterium]
MAWPWTVTQMLATAFVCFGGYFFVHGLVRLFRRNPEQRWHQVPGKIVTSEVEFTREIYRAKIGYRYHFQGMPFEGSGIAPIQAWSSFRSTAAHFVGKYPVGQEVTVYVNPANPGNTVLEPQQQPIAAITDMLLGIAMGVCGFLGWLTSGP